MIPLIEERKGELFAICRRYGVRMLDVFGSAVSGTFDSETSDLDSVVDFIDYGPGIAHARSLRMTMPWICHITPVAALSGPTMVMYPTYQPVTLSAANGSPREALGSVLPHEAAVVAALPHHTTACALRAGIPRHRACALARNDGWHGSGCSVRHIDVIGPLSMTLCENRGGAWARAIWQDACDRELNLSKYPPLDRPHMLPINR